MGYICKPSAGKCAICGRRDGCRKVKEVSQWFIDKWGVEQFLTDGMVISNGAVEDGEEVFFWTSCAADVCRDLISEIKF